ncbi:sex peptide receptor-like [Sitophilus oryzae]|uniref:Sex peptide receptor-like n=1 Tax=Sitophilus oryzae TaxID=7048 RepID=A0A6J2XZG4_SITOR|nr:sex peptide receptor-like [Sitophilus oryzae]
MVTDRFGYRTSGYEDYTDMNHTLPPTFEMTNYSYCDLEDFRTHYQKHIHGYLSLTVCIFGSLANIFNICVLRTKHMRSPTNYILTGLAIADLLVMLEYIPFTIHRNLPPNPLYYSHFSYSWAIYYKFHASFTLILHFIACCLTILLAIWRYVFVSRLQASKICSDETTTVICIMLTYLACSLVCCPMIPFLKIITYEQRCDRTGIIIENKDSYKYNSSEFYNYTIYLLSPNDPLKLSVWVYSVLLKLVPCALLTVLSYKIISALIETRRRRLKLLGCNMEAMEKNTKSHTIQLYKENQSDRTTKMLLAVLILFLVTEFPQGILGQISALKGDVFLKECYNSLGEIMDILALINSSINFILYCTMSRQFRVTFEEMFRIKAITNWFYMKRTSNRNLQEEHAVETKTSLV